MLGDVLTLFFFFFKAEAGIRFLTVTGVQTCALPFLSRGSAARALPPAVGHGERGELRRAPAPPPALRVLVDPARRAETGAGGGPGRARAAPRASGRDRRPARRGGHARRARTPLRGAAGDDRRAGGGGLRVRDGRRAARGLLTAARQEAHEVQPLAEPALHDRAVAQHLPAEDEDLARPEVEAPVERLERAEDLGARQVRIADHARLCPPPVHEALGLEPAALERLAVERGARIGRGERELERVRIDLLREPDRRLDRLARLARPAHDERAGD